MVIENNMVIAISATLIGVLAIIWGLWYLNRPSPELIGWEASND